MITGWTERENEESVDGLQNEMTNLKVLIDKLLEQNAEGNRQVDAAPTVSSYDTQASTIVIDHFQFENTRTHSAYQLVLILLHRIYTSACRAAVTETWDTLIVLYFMANGTIRWLTQRRILARYVAKLYNNRCRMIR